MPLEEHMALDVATWRQIETKWQAMWEKNGVFEADPIEGKPKFFINFPYPYMNGLTHLGHAFSASRCDALARFKRAQGFNVLFPQGWHCTGTPINAAARRIREREQNQIKIIESMGFPPEEVQSFSEPAYWIKIFPRLAERDFKALGISIDWRRSFVTTDVNPVYDKFVRWQFDKLREKGYVTKGEHPVVWCPKDNMPVGDHDRLDGEGEVPQEFMLLKFKLGQDYLVAATLRSETIFGLTNLWVNPDTEYVTVAVGNERWIVSNKCAEKLKLQKQGVDRISRVNARDLIGRQAAAPKVGKMVPILPATFCKPGKGTGIVTSVPSESPQDYVALMDLQNCLGDYDAQIRESASSIKPIPIIAVGGRALPGVDVVRKTGIKRQDDPRLEDLTKAAYKESLENGVLTENCGAFSGKTVAQARDELRTEFLSSGDADLLCDLVGDVTCRCLTPSTVKIVSDQWFLNYSNPAWKETVRAALTELVLYPEEIRTQLANTVEWLKDWACVREHGNGTKLPWDEKWTIESLSDSTIYMAYYTIAKYLEHPDKFGIDISKVDNSVFDFVLLGKGDVETVSKTTSISRNILQQMRAEFTYWYPFDFRGSGKDLVQNHLAFCLFNHVAVFPAEHWPKAFGVNGWLLVNGEKMSKSKGNFYTIQQVLGRYSADVVRTALLTSSEKLNDPNFNFAAADALQKNLLAWYNFALRNYGKGLDNYEPVDAWLESIVARSVSAATAAFEDTRFKTALEQGFYKIQNGLRWYLRRKARPNKMVLSKLIETQTQLLAPFAPHLAEEIWQNIRKETQLGLPEYSTKVINEQIELREEMLIGSLNDASNMLRLVRKKKPGVTKLYFYVKQEELRLYLDAQEFLERELGINVVVHSTTDPNRYDPQQKSQRALRGKSGIYIE